MTKNEKIARCEDFFLALCERLSRTHELLPSCNMDISNYLCVNGTTGEVSYYGKPEQSFRISDHWNWYSNIRKCRNESMIQCNCLDLPEATERLRPGAASKPINAVCIALYSEGAYHTVYGEYYDSESREWKWRENDIESVCRLINAFSISPPE